MRTNPFFTPSEIERETGFGKDQLRKWRQRFGFPPRELALDGQSIYSLNTVSQLHLIKRLLEAGFRPAQVVGTTESELEKLNRHSPRTPLHCLYRTLFAGRDSQITPKERFTSYFIFAATWRTSFAWLVDGWGCAGWWGSSYDQYWIRYPPE